MWTVLIFFIEFVAVLLLFYVLFFSSGHEAYGILAPRPGIEPTTPVLEAEVLTTVPLCCFWSL